MPMASSVVGLTATPSLVSRLSSSSLSRSTALARCGGVEAAHEVDAHADVVLEDQHQVRGGIRHEDDGVVAGAVLDPVGTRAVDEHVVVAADDPVVAVAPVQPVVAFAAAEQILVDTAEHDVLSAAALHVVVAGPAVWLTWLPSPPSTTSSPPPSSCTGGSARMTSLLLLPTR